MKELVKHTIGIWILLFALCLPFNFSIVPHPGIWITEIFYPLTHWIGQSLLGLELVSKATTSDAATLYIQMALMGFIAGAISVLLHFQRKFKLSQLYPLLHISCVYIMAFFLLKYGLDKLFHFQFYPPEPNTLFTPIGNLSKDILFWSTMGSSSQYNTFMGLIEVVPGLMLLWNRTRMLGALIGLGVLINVFAINIGFDITVKLLSIYLVVLSLYVLTPWYKTLTNLFFYNSERSTVSKQNSLPLKPMLKRLFKGGVIVVFVLELLTPYIDADSFSGVDYSEVVHYGSYEVLSPEVELFGNTNIRRVHIHSKGYFILESMKGEFTDYSMHISPIDNKIVFKNSHANIAVDHNGRLVKFSWMNTNGTLTTLITKPVDLDELQLKDDSYHWTVDGLINSVNN